MKQHKVETLIAVWPGMTNDLYFGDHDYCNTKDITSWWVSLRGRYVTDDPTRKWYDVSVNEYNCLGLYVWASLDGCISIEPRYHDLHSLTLDNMGPMMKLLKSLTAKAKRRGYEFGSFARHSSLLTELTKVASALEIVGTVEYESMIPEPRVSSAASAIKRISVLMEGRIARMGGWKEAA
jgi:hypothetical protein